MNKEPKCFETSALRIFLIVGGGLVGAVAARALSNSGLSVIVVDGQDPVTCDPRPAFDGRASAVAAASKRLLTAIDIWPYLEKDVSPILDIRVADGAVPNVSALRS